MTLKNKKNRAGGPNTRANVSRRRILAAARTVFARYPYGAAGVRKIEEEGGFNYALIRYYFGSKRGLFEAVAAELAGEYIHHLLPVIKKILNQVDPETALQRFVDELFDFGFDHQDGPATIMLNIGQDQLLDGTLMGLAAMRRYVSQITGAFNESIPFQASDQEIAMWVFTLIILSANFIGAKTFHAAVLNLDPQSDQYRRWVKEAVLSIYSPVMQYFLHGRGSDPEIAIARGAEQFLTRPPAPVTTPPKKKTKGEITREKILDAAQSVFTKRPYNMASIRQIGQEGGFDFTIIHHYFPTKKELAEAVGSRFYNDFFQQSGLWLSLIHPGDQSRLSLFEGLSVYISKLLDYLFDNQHGPAMIMQNIAQSHPIEAVPAFDLSLRFYTDIFTRLRNILLIKAPEKSVRMWQYCLVTLIANCVGAPAYPARIAGHPPGGGEYKKWIKTALVFLFYPGLKSMVTPTSTP